MASSTLLKTLPKFGAAIARRSSTSNPTLFLFHSYPKSIQTSPPQEPMEAKDAINQAVMNESMMPGENMMKDKAYSTAQHASDRRNDMASMVGATAREISEKAKQTMEAAWESAKDTAERAKDTVVESAQETKEYVKANAESVKKSMNTKNRA